MIFLVQFGINKYLLIYSCLFIPNCIRNHLITYTNVKGLAIGSRYWFIHLTRQKLSASLRSCWEHFV